MESVQADIMYARNTHWNWCDALSLTSREHRLRMYDNRRLQGVFARNREEKIGCWRELRNENLSHFYFPSGTITIII